MTDVSIQRLSRAFSNEWAVQELDLEIASGEMRRLDWEQRQVIFEAARDAEDSGMLSRAIELYESLGRAEDVRRLISQREGADV